MRIAVVETFTGEAMVLEALLVSEGHRVDIFAEAGDCLADADIHAYDFFIIDRSPPDAGGAALLTAIRVRGRRQVPVICCLEPMDGARAAELLGAGADECVAKPIRYTDLIARIDRLVRCRQAAVSSDLLRVGQIEVDAVARRVRVGGTVVELTEREFELALLLLGNVGRVLAREELLLGAWSPRSGVDPRTVDTHACRLRKKLGLNGRSGLVLTAVYGRGYRLDSVLPG